MANIIKISNDLTVSSREVAEKFGKEHRHVVEAIENKIENLTRENSAVKISDLFVVGEYKHRGNVYKEYHLTRDGFSFIVMGFTGSKADIWKLKFIEAFNRMEETIKSGALPKLKRPALGSVNVAAKTLMQVYNAAGVDPRFTALAVTELYNEKADTSLIPPIRVDDNEIIYDKTSIAKELGIVSESGKPHPAAIGAVIAKLSITDNEVVNVPYSRNGHSGFEKQYKRSVIEKISCYFKDNGYPSKIENNGRSYSVNYTHFIN